MCKLQQLLDRCKCGVHIDVNEHKNIYQSIEDAVEELYDFGNDPEILDEIKSEILKRDNLIQIQFYPDTTVGSYSITHYDLDVALDQALECLDGV